MPGQRLLEPELEVLDKLLVSRYFARLGSWRPSFVNMYLVANCKVSTNNVTLIKININK